jgi:hypothetical protein
MSVENTAWDCSLFKIELSISVRCKAWYFPIGIKLKFLQVEIKSRYRKHRELIHVCCVACEVSKPSLEISPVCIILIMSGGYHLTLPVARCCTVKNTARVFWEQQFFAVWSCALRNGTIVAKMYCSDCSRVVQPLVWCEEIEQTVGQNSVQYIEQDWVSIRKLHK